MITSNFAESTIEQTAIDWRKSLDYAYAFSSDIAFKDERPKHGDFQETLLTGRLQ